MAEITVYFVGVCTHVRDQAPMKGDHRVLLVNAWNGDTINRLRIDPHEARLWLNEKQHLPLKGVSVTLNATQTGVTYDGTFERCIERALEYAPDLDSLDQDVLRPKDSRKIAALFEAGGRYYGGVDDHGASVAKLEVVTYDPPVLTITPFGSDQSQEIELKDGAILQIENLGRKASDDHDFDFLLHYRIGTSIPEKAGWPEKRKACTELVPPFPHNTTGPGCANSTYP